MAGGTTDYTFTLKVLGPGPFTAQIQLNVFDGDYGLLVLSVHGTGVNGGRGDANLNP